MSALRASFVRYNLAGPDGRFLLTILAIAAGLVLTLAALSHGETSLLLQRWMA